MDSYLKDPFNYVMLRTQLVFNHFRQVDQIKLCKGGQQVCGCGHWPPKSMTVHDVVTSNGHHKPEEEEETEKTNSVKPGRGTSCFFEWELLPQHRVEGHDSKFFCDLCQDEIQGSEVKLKLHQIGLHLNPYYLSASDRILAQISSYVVQTEKTEDWVPDWDTFKVRSDFDFKMLIL